MTRLLAVTFTLTLAFALAGCDKNKDTGMTDAAAAEPVADPGFEPVDVSGDAAGMGYVEPTPVAPVTPSAPAVGNSYMIRKGDTLWSIARRHYGNGQRWQDIANANPGLDPQKLPVGQTIVLP